tara:strand:+ start:51 stop:1292 length:1242 start_codon:yes stop_codon:yes gene_type:complete
MKKLLYIQSNRFNPAECTLKIANTLASDTWLQVLPPEGEKVNIPPNSLPEGPGIIMSSSGSTGGPHQCLQPCKNLDQSAFATGQWLKAQGIEPKHSRIFNPLPIHHVSGFMPWWRSKAWGAHHTWINPALMRDPYELEQSSQLSLVDKAKPSLLSLVPTQLKRLLKNSTGIRWLQSFAVIWIGGSSLPNELANIARQNGIRLAPCYGTTETMAMVTALSPEDFLKGQMSSGSPLSDVELRIGENKALEIRSRRISTTIFRHGKLENILTKDGWWKSGDSAKIVDNTNLKQLQIIGRLDSAINSGGETIFPEHLQQRLVDDAVKAQIPIDSILFTSMLNDEWGERLVVLIKLRKKCDIHELSKIFSELKQLVKHWKPAEKPMAWYHCQSLRMNSNNKWEIKQWQSWIKINKPIL